jgi:hypothetical protein
VVVVVHVGNVIVVVVGVGVGVVGIVVDIIVVVVGVGVSVGVVVVRKLAMPTFNQSGLHEAFEDSVGVMKTRATSVVVVRARELA